MSIKETKILIKACALIGHTINEHQARLVLAFAEKLNEKGDSMTLGDIDQISQIIASQMKTQKDLKIAQ